MGSHEIYNFLSPYPTDFANLQYTKFGKEWPSSCQNTKTPY